jgi:hypothetical protein
MNDRSTAASTRFPWPRVCNAGTTERIIITRTFPQVLIAQACFLGAFLTT